MSTFWIIILVFAVLSFVVDKVVSKSPDTNLVFNSAVAISIILTSVLIAIRGPSGIDYDGYLYIFNEINPNAKKFSEIFLDFSIEPAYQILIYLVKYFDGSFAVFQFVYASIVGYLFFSGATRLIGNRFYIFGIYLTTAFPFLMGQQRMAIVFSISLLVLVSLINRERMKAFFWIIVATNFHSVAVGLVYLLIGSLFVSVGREVKRLGLILTIFVTISAICIPSLININFLFEFFLSFFFPENSIFVRKYLSYAGDVGSMAVSYYGYLAVVVISLGFLVEERHIRIKQEIRFFIYILLIGCLISLSIFSPFAHISTRFNMMLAVPLLLLLLSIPYLTLSFRLILATCCFGYLLNIYIRLATSLGSFNSWIL